jgi:tryptophan 2,3-dioxygenase
MSDVSIRAALNELDLRELIEVQRRCGRMYLPGEFKRFWAAQHNHAKELTSDTRRGPLVKRMAQLLYEITFSLATVPEGGKPNYYQYIDVGLLDWYLGAKLAKLPEIKSRGLEGVYFLLRDLLEFEARSLGGFERNHRENLDREKVHRRIDEIARAIQLLHILRDPSFECDTPHFMTLEQYADEPSKLCAMLHFSCMPLTQNHDEVAFIRVLHGSELCFLGVRVALATAIEAIKSGNGAAATHELNDAVEFVLVLQKLLRVLKTMPVEHFAHFRDYTGKASALQSMGYHLMDIYLRGVNTQKAEHFKAVDQLKVLLRYTDPRFVSLKQALARCDEQASEWQEVFKVSRELDRQLLTWRGLHLSFAKVYIPAGLPGTGGTSGAPYLKKHLHTGIFNDTEPDWDLLREVFPEVEPPGEFRVRSGISISPSKSLLAGSAEA